MWGLRRQASLLLANGHPHARRYPLGMLWDESRIVVERINGVLATEAVLLRQAITSVFSDEGAKGFSDTVSRLTEE